MNFKLEFAKLLQSQILDVNINLESIINNIEIPPNSELGDLCFPTFVFAKTFKKKPIDIANDLLSKLNLLKSDFFEFSSLNAYVNAKIKTSILFKDVVTKVLSKNNDYGKNKALLRKEYTLDTFNTNPLKALHIGHLRNIVTGDVIYRLLSFANQVVHPIYYGGDVGTHIAKWYWYYLTLNDKEKIIPSKDVSKWFGNIYLKAGDKLRNDPTLEKEISAIQKDLLTNKDLQKEIIKLRDICYESYMSIKRELDITLEDHIFESQSQDRFFKIKDEVFANNKDIIKTDNGAVIADLKKQNLDVLVLVKDNGAPLYASKDIGLVELKKELFPKSNDFLYVVGSEQKHYFKQLFTLFSFIYPDTSHKHISYGLVNLGSEKMSSRAGGLVLYEDFRDLIFKKVKSVLKENNLEDNLEIIKEISFGTIKFEMLKIGLNKTINFDINHALNLQGDSAVYIQYTGVRSKSILNKCGCSELDLNDLSLIDNFELDVEELKLLKLINDFPNKVTISAVQLKPNIISNYCLELAHCFNKFYSNSVIINSNEIIKKRRLLLTKVYLITLQNALKLLGIKIPSAM